MEVRLKAYGASAVCTALREAGERRTCQSRGLQNPGLPPFEDQEISLAIPGQTSLTSPSPGAQMLSQLQALSP